MLVDISFINFRYIWKGTDRSTVFLVSLEIFFKNWFYISIFQLLWKSTYFNSVIRICLIKSRKNIAIIFNNFGWKVITFFITSKARISLNKYLNNLKVKQSEEFLASLILRTLAWWEPSLKDGTGRDRIITWIRQYGTVNFKSLNNFLKMILQDFNFIFFFCFFLFLSLVSKIWIDSLPKFSIVGYSLHIETIVKIPFRFS